MKKIVPILTAKQYREAEEAGAVIEFTACGCDYGLPPGSGGWIIPANKTGWIQRDLADGIFKDRVRAVYPDPTLIQQIAAMFRRAVSE